MICGIGLSDYPLAPHLNSTQHHAQAMQRALADCGMAKSDLDGYVNASASQTDGAIVLAPNRGVNRRNRLSLADRLGGDVGIRCGVGRA